MDEPVIITLRVEHMKEQVMHAMMLRKEEVSKLVEQGVDRALKNVGDVIIDEAAKAVTTQVNDEILSYFKYGKGRDAIRDAVNALMEPIAMAIAKVKKD